MVTVGVDSYADESQLTAYATARGLAIDGDPSAALIKAMDFLSVQQWSGSKTDPFQPLDFPRDGETTVPANIVTAQLILAIDADSGISLLGAPQLAVKRSKVDVIETEYATGSGIVYTLESNTQLNSLLKPYIYAPTSGGTAFTVWRG